MKNLYTLLRSFAPTVLKLPVLGLAAMVMLLSGGAPRTETADGTGSGFTTFDAPGAGTTASALQGTAAFSINAAGDIAGFETDSSGVHHGFVRSAAGAFTEFDASGVGAGQNQGTQPLSIDA